MSVKKQSDSEKRLSERLGRFNRAKPKQIKYLEILFNDCGYTTRALRNSYMSSHVSREIKFLDELSVSEASHFIGELKVQRDGDRYMNQPWEEDEDYDDR